MGFKSFFNYKEGEKENKMDSLNTENGEENENNKISDQTSKDEGSPSKIDDKDNKVFESDKCGEDGEMNEKNEELKEGNIKENPKKRKKSSEAIKGDNNVEKDNNENVSKKKAKCNISIEEDLKSSENKKDVSEKGETSCNKEIDENEKNKTVSSKTTTIENNNNNINLENYRNYQYYYNQYYGNLNNVQTMGSDIGNGYSSNISKESFQNKKNNSNNNINAYPEFNNFNNIYMPIGMNNYYNMYNYNYINGYANIGNVGGINNHNYNYYYDGNVENSGMYDYSKDLVNSGGNDMKNYAFFSLINRSLELMKTSDKVKAILKNPARLQVTQEELNKVEHTQENQNSNIWFGKYVTDKNNNNNPKFVAKYKCNPSKDSGYTKADKSYANKPYFCIYFARGCCAYGHNCLYRHRIPTENDELEFENTMDIFGREKYNTFKEDMNGNGNFNNDCRTLFIGSIYINNFNEVNAIEKVLYDEFVIYGNIDYVRFIPNKNIAFIQFTNRVNAEFARVAMSDQPLANYSISLTIKWAFDMKTQPSVNPINYYNGMNNVNPYFYNSNQTIPSNWSQYMPQNPYGASSNLNYYDQANNLSNPTIGPANFPPNFTANKGKAVTGPSPIAPNPLAVPTLPIHPPLNNNNAAQNGKKKK
ncbi:pre-mRNA-splicing factor CWC2, putative [Plasmodium berghei]|uniref:Pre-mRNA-splicing factor CWC2, putative n=2 Tax=Plasmodium berghei TaxID=5821 RepID=A0A509AKG0_PLABA|nr:pre-mRNA-splicing factor CWC2, putative [Plasmodium berghei ANKA]CXI62415.1 pre-mRNA-splicing factor CWC2, putative [Plasmodium berghei]SCM23713.1 pre-mRNA-splicing factor CWC2, putative [Plasmodium berghei]SCN26737.1 pre-mRNA-splicing factor CWC2, putative [Plasmodium berghei]SCO61050.1 pre-mRNA-splicing factor CWC2, putative [Plasmodium berghei]SCO63156.1 pre-mRNA-splicing factor CWC2, putative [Plasmodium berghei]|eukprot:XP_034422353.1 pre-mRNA-splicing factor CWC2, putative [Plasmodium berghei ANKA]